ncbi:MAG: ribonuclease HII [Bacillota bacterium]|nr:ribonuclease HII [Bacillota bacterium]
MPDLFQYEEWARRHGYALLCGVDEAGRGPLAGPVVAAAVIMPPSPLLWEVRDSKLLSAPVRARLYEEIRRVALDLCIVAVGVEEIDRLNILRAAEQAMRQAIAGLRIKPDLALVDGLPLPNCPVPQKAIVDGDRLSYSIAAASILAKVYRDGLMEEYDRLYPQYGFAQHKGYCTPQHLKALAAYGPCPVHRRSFRPVAECARGGKVLESTGKRKMG